MPFFIIRSIAWVLLHLGFRYYGGIRFVGRENVPRQGGVLITPNHISNADPPAIGIAVPRPCYFMANETLFARPILGRFMRWLHGFPVKVNAPDRAALRRAEEILKQGEALVIFPEGEQSEDGRLLPMQPGVLLLAQRANVPIVPVIIEGTDLVIPYQQEKPRRASRPVVIRFGKPVTAAELMGSSRGGEALRAGAERLYEIMLALKEGRPYPPSLTPTGDRPSASRETLPVSTGKM
jgi:1-acyl-sn-glycerol-3-phosphate acyltransferase